MAHASTRHRPDRKQAKLHGLLPWVYDLTGLEADRVRDACAQIAGWPVPWLADRLRTPRDVDDAVRAVLLFDDVELLAARAVPRTKLMAKLRDRAQFSATWAELRGAAIIVQTSIDEVTVAMEDGKSSGINADLRLVYTDPPHESIEFKAIGLSDAEADFCRRMSPSLDSVLPTSGMAVADAPLEGKPPQLTAAQLQWGHRDAARRALMVPGFPAGMATATIHARGAERHYVRRVTKRVVEAARQLPPGDDCWVALYWTNGAAVRDVIAALDWSLLPRHVAGLIFVGQVVAFPHRNIDVFRLQYARGWRPEHDRAVASEVDDQLAAAVLDRTESSSGVRACLIRGPVGGKRRQLLRRDGSDRIPPFNLVLDRDRYQREAAA
jgi:hypothetical protein